MIFSGVAHIPSCKASFNAITPVGYATVIIQLKDKLGKPIQGNPPDIEFKLTLSPDTIPEHHDPIQEAIPGGYKISYYASTSSYKVGAGVPPEYDIDTSNVKFTLSISEKHTGRHIYGSPFTNAIYISPAKSPAFPQKSNTDLPKISNSKQILYAGNAIKFHIFARDSFGESSIWSNLVETQDDEFKVIIVHLSTGTNIEPTLLSAIGGIHPVEFTPTLSGLYNISVLMKSAESWLPIGESVNELHPITIEVLNSLSITDTVVKLDENTSARAGEPLTFDIVGKDVHGNLVNAVDSYKVIVEDEALNTSFSCDPLRIGAESLVASCLFTKVIPGSSSKIRVYTSAGELVSSSNVEIHHGPSNVNATQVEGIELVVNASENGQWQLLTKTGINSSLFVNLYDVFSNQVSHGGETIRYEFLEFSTPITGASVEVIDLLNGTYELVFNSDSPNHINISITLNGSPISFGDLPFLHWVIEPNSDVYIKNIFPSAGPTEGNTNVTVYTSILYPNSIATCWFVSEENTVPAVMSKTLDFVRCTSPTYAVQGIASLGIVIFTSTKHLTATWNSFYYYDKHVIPSKLYPTWVDIKGEELEVEAESIVETGIISCRFTPHGCPSVNESVVTSAKSKPEGKRVSCPTPALPSKCTLMVDISLNSQQYHGSPLPLHFIDDFLPVVPDHSITTQQEKSIDLDLRKDIKVAFGTASLSVPEPPINGALELKSDILVYTPKKRFFGNDQLSYAVEDERGRVVKGNVDIFVQRTMAGPSVSFPSKIFLNFSTYNSLSLGKRFEGIRIADPALYSPLSDGTKLELSVFLEISNGTFEIPHSLKNTIHIKNVKKDTERSISFEADLQMANLVLTHIYYRPELLNGIPKASNDNMLIKIQEISHKKAVRQLLPIHYSIPIVYILPDQLKIPVSARISDFVEHFLVLFYSSVKC